MKKNSYSVLVIGSGGREHTFAWVLSKDQQVKKIYCCPGNGGTERIAENVKINIGKHEEIISFVKNKKIDLTIVGPELPLAEGIVDSFKKHKLRIFGPDAYCAQLESSKLFARDLMSTNNIPHPKYFKCSNKIQAQKYKDVLGFPLVLKADGLAAGKGVIICNDDQEFNSGINTMFHSKTFGDASKHISLEECLLGEELSVFAICDGKNYKILNSAQDHKRLKDDDIGPNTGGMGAYSPTSLSNKNLLEEVGETIIDPTLKAMQKCGHPYLGFLYVGLMLVNNKPYVIEFNVRMGDPETQVVLPLMKNSLFELIWSASNQQLNNYKISNHSKTAVTIVLSLEGYPNKYPKNIKINGLEKLEDELVFHAGTKLVNGDYLTTGGRVLNVVGFGNNLMSAIENAYKLAQKIDYKGKYFRKDIGRRGLKYQGV
tara:strand:+ start:1473 stop:2759 length:1287 start_codon:yes stop_codon:yes gene_type:complete